MIDPPLPQPMDHHANCRADYPEKPEGEAAQQIFYDDMGEGFGVWICVDCGATVNNLPPPGHPYWSGK